jgi:hypothetical protein
MKIPGLKDWRTTGPAVVFAASLFISHYPDLFPDTERWAVWVKALVTFVVGPGSVIVWGINSASNAKVKEKTEEHLEKRLNEVVPVQAAANPPNEIPKQD